MPSLPSTYKAIVVAEPNAPFTIEERPIPNPGPGQALVKVLACGVCHSDFVTKLGQFPGIPYPKVPGHELVGDIAALGANVAGDWKVGDRVGAGWVGSFCGHCNQCLHEEHPLCENGTVTGVHHDGGYAEYALVDQSAIVSIPKDLDPAEAAPLLCAGLTVFNGLKQVRGSYKGELVAVEGIGGLGHLAIQFAKKLGYKVAALSTSDAKKELAIKLGADYYLTPGEKKQSEQLKELGGARIFVSTTNGSESSFAHIDALMPGGTFLVISPLNGPGQFDAVTMLIKKKTIQGVNTGDAKEATETIAFARENGVHTMIQKYNGLDLDSVNEAWDAMSSGKVRFRSVLVFN